MKILQIVPYFYPAVTLGGTVHAVFESSKSLHSKGHYVSVFTTDLKDRNLRQSVRANTQIDISGLKVTYFKNISNSLAYGQHLFSPIGFYSKLSEVIKEYDVVHIHEVYTYLSIVAAYLSKKNHVPYIVTCHGTLMSVKEAGRVQRKKIFYSVFGKSILHNSYKVVAITREERESERKLEVPVNKIIDIPNGIVSVTLPKIYRDVVRKQYHLEKGETVFLFFGRIHRKKGIDLIINALKILLDNQINAKLLIVGPIEDKKYYSILLRLINELSLNNYVQFKGEVTGKDKGKVFLASDLFILPSYGEVQSISALEAGSNGLPLVVSRNCGLVDIEKYHAGKFVQTNSEDIASKLLEILLKPDYRKYYGEGARKMIVENYSLEKSVDQLQDVYKEAISSFAK